MKFCYILLFVAVVLFCQNKTTAQTLALDNEKPIVNGGSFENNEKLNSKDEVIKSIPLPCGNKEYILVLAENSTRKYFNFTEKNKIKTTINLPNQNEVNGFSLNWANKTKDGFEISIEYGSRYYYQKQFNFICKKNTFYLNKIKIESFDKQDAENSGKENDIKIRPNIPVEKFKITDYMND